MSTDKPKSADKYTKRQRKDMLCRWKRKEVTRVCDNGVMIDQTDEINKKLLPPTPPTRIA